MNVQELLKQKEFAAKEAKRRQQAQENNQKELDSFCKNYSLGEKGRQELTDIMAQIEERVFNLKAVLGDELSSEGIPFNSGSTTGVLSRSAFSVLQVSSPELEKKVREQRAQAEAEAKAKNEAEAAEKAAREQKETNEKRCFWLSKKLGGEIPGNFLRFLEENPIPLMRTFFQGSPAYVRSLARNHSDAVVYGDLEGDIFAVAYENERFERVVTFYVKEIDYRSEFAERLIREAGLGKDLANRISAELPHDCWYVIMDPRRGTEALLEYSRKVAERLHLKNGDIVCDLLQGEVKAFTFGKAYTKNGVEYSPCYLQVQDAPSAILVGKYLNLYLPN